MTQEKSESKLQTVFTLDEITTYKECPERENFVKKTGSVTETLEDYYAKSMRIVLIEYYTQLMMGKNIDENDLRRLWSSFWDTSMYLKDRSQVTKNNTLTATTLSNEEYFLLKGAKAISVIIRRELHKHMDILAVDEPFSLTLGDLNIVGRYDLVFRPRVRFKNIWVVEWAKVAWYMPVIFDLRYSIFLHSIQQSSLKPKGILTDYIGCGVNKMTKSRRTPKQIKKDIEEAKNICTGIQHQVYFRNIGDNCTQCRFKNMCLEGDARGRKGFTKGKYGQLL